MRNRPAPDHPYDPFPREALDGTIPQRFEWIVSRYADRPAVEDAGSRLTYRKLDRDSAGVADRLRAVPDLLADPPRPVALLLEQGAEFITALLGVLRAGSFAVPLDPRNPASRNRLVLDDSRARILIGNTRSLDAAGDLTRGVRILDLDDSLGFAAGSRPTPADPNAIATLLYTSGSTGRPKGVVQTHRNVLHNTLRHTNEFRIVPRDRFSLLYPCGVYGGVRDIFNALLNGACLCRYRLDVDGLGPLGEWLIDRRITIYCSVATVFRQLIRTLDGLRFPDVRLIKLGGEVVFRSDFEAFRRCFERGALLSCGLAATEVGAVRQFFLDHDTELDLARVPCGFEVEDMEVRIVADDGSELPSGESGEIVVCSEYLAAGYWMRPELTARRFAPDRSAGSRRCYRTGDMGFLRDDGQLIHVGRRDGQVKLRGNRVEIPEVEAALLELDAVREAAVLLRNEPERGNRLDAYVVADETDFDEAAMRSTLARTLPAFMIPSRIDRLDVFPLLPNGKIDRRSLPQAIPAVSPALPRVDDRELPTTVREMSRIWAELLEREVGPDDDFFESGGDSLALLQLMVLIEQRFSVRLALNVILEAPTVSGLATRVDSPLAGERGRAPRTRSKPIADRPEGEIGLALMPIQPSGDLPPLFFVAPAGGSVLSYYRLAHLLGRDQPFYGLQVAPPQRRGQPIEIRAVARRFLRLIRSVHPAGPCVFGGWSFGGFVAWEMAAQSRGGPLDVGTVLLVDSNATLAGERPAGLARLEGLWTMLQMLRHSRPFLRNTLFLRLASSMRRQGRDVPAGWAARLAWRLGIKNATAAEAVAADPRLLDLQAVPGGRVRNLRAYVEGIQRYIPPESDQRADLFLPDLDSGRRERKRFEAIAERWARFSRGHLRSHHLLGNHFTIFHPPHVERMARSIRHVLREPQATGIRASSRPAASINAASTRRSPR